MSARWSNNVGFVAFSMFTNLTLYLYVGYWLVHSEIACVCTGKYICTIGHNSLDCYQYIFVLGQYILVDCIIRLVLEKTYCYWGILQYICTRRCSMFVFPPWVIIILSTRASLLQTLFKRESTKDWHTSSPRILRHIRDESNNEVTSRILLLSNTTLFEGRSF